MHDTGTGHLPPDLERLGRLLDSQFRIPGTRFRFGWDSLLGLIPGVGDLAPSLLSLYIWWRARQLGVDASTQWRMLANVGLDFLVGTVPLAGDAFDAFFKANLRNLRLMERALARRVEGGAAAGLAPAAHRA